MLLSCFSPADSVFSLASASTGWQRCNLTTYGLYNWCRSRHECVPSCRHVGILRLKRKISIDVRNSDSLSELLWSQLSSVSTNWTSEPALCRQRSVSLSRIWCLVFVHHFPKTGDAQPQRGGRCGKMLLYSDIMAMEAIKGLQKTTKDIFWVVLFSIKWYLTLSHLLQACNNKTSIFTLSPGWNLAEN